MKTLRQHSADYLTLRRQLGYELKEAEFSLRFFISLLEEEGAEFITTKHWDLIKAMPRERLERTVVWQQVRSNTRKQKLDGGLLRKVEENPDLKRHYENLLKHVPEDQRDRAKVSIARTLVLSQSRGEKQKTGVGV